MQVGSSNIVRNRGPPVNEKDVKHPICNGLERVGERLATLSP